MIRCCLGAFAHRAVLLKLNPQERVFVEQLLGKIVAEAAQERPGRELYLRVLLTELLLFAARHPVDDRPEDAGPGRARSIRRSPRSPRISTAISRRS